MRGGSVACILLLLAGCTAPVADTGSEPAPLPVSIDVANDGAVPAWVKVEVFRPGGQKEGGERMLTGGSTAHWSATVAPGPEYEISIQWAQSDIAGWQLGFRGALAASSCPKGSGLLVESNGGWDRQGTGFHSDSKGTCQPSGDVLWTAG